MICGQLDSHFKKGFNETLNYKNEHGTTIVPRCYITRDGYWLGSWVVRQRYLYKNRVLSADKIEQLDAIGFVWDLLDEQWENGFHKTLKYKDEYGTPNAPKLFLIDGFKLGVWQGTQRRAFKKGRLSDDHLKRLETIGFVWNILDEQWEKGFQETLEYKKTHASSNAPNNYKTLKGFPLGQWQDTQRTKYRRHELTVDQLRRMNEISFTWFLQKNRWEKGFQETLIYNNKFGTPNVASKSFEQNGYSLGAWQYKVRYNKQKLSADQIRRLDEIGFIWDKKRSNCKDDVSLLCNKLTSNTEKNSSIANHKISIECERSLAQDILAGDNEARERMINAHLWLVATIGKRYINRGLDFEDIMQSGHLGLIKAVDKYSNRGFRFSSYAQYFVEGEIKDAIKNQTSIVHRPRRIFRRTIVYKDTQRKLAQDLNRQPLADEIARGMDVSIDQIHEIEQAIPRSYSLDDSLDFDTDTTFKEHLRDPNSCSPINAIVEQFNLNNLHECISLLSETEQTVIRTSFGFESGLSISSYDRIGEQLGITKNAVIQTKLQAIHKLRSMMKSQEMLSLV